ISSSGGGTAVTGSGTVSSATQQVTGIDVSGLIDGTLTVSVTLTDAGGNEGSPATDTVEKDTVVPSGYTIVIDQSRIDPLNVDALSFTFAGAEVGSTYNYSISSSSGGTPVTGSGTVALATQQITAIDVSSLPDGILTVSVILTDAAGNAGSAAVHTVEKDAVAPMGYTIAIDQAYINNSNKASMSFTFAEAEIGTTYSYSISSSGGGTAVTGSGTVSSATQQVTGINVSGLTDGTLTVSVTLTDAGGNEGLPATGTVAKDTVVPSGYTIAIEQSGIDASNVASLSFTFTGAETGSTYSYSISSSVGGTPVTGSGTVASASHKVTGIDVSGLPDGTLTVRVILTDAAGNAGAEAEKTVPKSTAPSPTGGDSNRGGSGSGTQPSSIQGQVFIDGKAQTAAIVSSKLSGGRRTTTVALDDKKIQENIGKGKDKSTLLIPASSGSPDEVTGSLNAQTIKVMQLKDSTIQIDTGSVIYTLPASKIDMEAIGAWAGKDTGLQDVKVNISVIKSISDVAKIAENTAADGGCSIVVAPVEFSITCTVGDRSTVVNRFNGYVDRMVAIPEGIDPSKITTGVILNRDGSFSHVPTVVIKQGGKDYAKMNSLTNSTYLVIWNPVTFADVESHIFKDEVNDAASRLIIDGLNDSSFGPDIKITRGEFVETIIRALGLLRTDKTTDKFKDVKPGSKYMASAAAAFEYGIVGGYGDGTFRPERLITREEAMNLIVRAMKVMGMDTEISEQSARSAVEKYADGAEVNKIAVKAAAICVRNGVFNGSSKGNLSPAENISRGQTAAVILRLLKKKELI
ncbi:S-layer family protein, partial [Anaerobacterium chartisolvens]